MEFKDVKISVELANLADRTSAIFDDWIEPFIDEQHSVPLRRLLDILIEGNRERAAMVSRLSSKGVLVRLPRIFAEDHAERDCKTGTERRNSGSQITYWITDGDTFDDWLSDADVYRSPEGFDFGDRDRVCRSAKRAYAILRELRADACGEFGHDYGDDSTVCRRCGEEGDEALQEPPSEFLQHRGELPHGIGCRGCKAAQLCNECGRATGTTQRHEVRDGVRYSIPLGCTNGRCPVCCDAVCKHRES